MMAKGPDGDNAVRVGRRHGTRLEAEAAVEMLVNCLKASVAD
jgi:hypothetical protein